MSWREEWENESWRSKPPKRERERRAATPVHVVAHGDLMEYYHRSAGQLGMGAQTYEPCGRPTMVTSPAISESQARAAGRVRDVERAMAQLDPESRGVLRICYRSRWAPYVEVYSPEQMPIAGDPAWERYYHLAFCCCRFGHGIAAGYLVHKLREQGPSDAAAERAQREEKQEALRAVARAHEAWRAVRREQGQEHAEERRRAAARRDAYLDRMLGLGEREAKERRNGARCQELLKELNG